MAAASKIAVLPSGARINQSTIHTKIVSKENHLESPDQQLPDAVKDVAHSLLAKADKGVERTRDLAQHAIHSTKEATHHATVTAREACKTAATMANDTLENSKECVRRNPVSMVLGAALIGAAVGYVVMNARRKPGFSERYADDPLLSVREVILAALSPVAQRVNDGYDAACDGVGKAMDRVHRHKPGRSSSTCSGRICRFGNKIKFW